MDERTWVELVRDVNTNIVNLATNMATKADIQRLEDNLVGRIQLVEVKAETTAKMMAVHEKYIESNVWFVRAFIAAILSLTIGMGVAFIRPASPGSASASTTTIQTSAASRH
jgi:hypothetical protein